jgi:hypothetical protein
MSIVAVEALSHCRVLVSCLIAVQMVAATWTESGPPTCRLVTVTNHTAWALKQARATHVLERYVHMVVCVFALGLLKCQSWG